MQNDKKKLYTLSLIFFIVFVVIVAWQAYTAVSRSGRIEVTIETLPKDSKVTIDNREHSPGKVYLPPGKYHFVAKKDGFVDDSISVNISENANYVGLIPTPESKEAIEKYSTEEMQFERERIAGEMSSTIGISSSEQSPLLNMLPYSNPAGPYVVDYVFDPADETYTKINIIIHKSTPDGRLKALKWIREQGVDIKTLNIEFRDYETPVNEADGGA